MRQALLAAAVAVAVSAVLLVGGRWWGADAETAQGVKWAYNADKGLGVENNMAVVKIDQMEGLAFDGGSGEMYVKASDGLMCDPVSGDLCLHVSSDRDVGLELEGAPGSATLHLKHVFTESGDTVRSVICNVETGKNGITLSWRDWTIGPTGQIKAIGDIQQGVPSNP